jgi:flagellar hook-associated protein 3 FlgL
MRAIDSSMYTGFQSDHQRSMKEIDRLNTQISSGRRIESSYEDTNVYSDALRLDNHQSALKEVQDRTMKSRVISDASDDAMQDFNGTLTYVKTKLIQAANAPMNSDNLRDLAVELEAQKDHLLNIANTSINGEYIFSGSATNVKPFDDLGNYKGNDKNLSVQLSRSKNMEYSINGKDLFLGVNNSVEKSLSTNVKLIDKDPNSKNFGETITEDSTIGQLIGSSTDSYFYLEGRKRDGESFRDKIILDDNHPVSDLLFKIGESFGNSSINKVVDVTLKDGLIVVDDLKDGVSQISFNMVGSSSDVPYIEDLEVGVNNTINFIKSDLVPVYDSSKIQNDSFYF